MKEESSRCICSRTRWTSSVLRVARRGCVVDKKKRIVHQHGWFGRGCFESASRIPVGNPDYVYVEGFITLCYILVCICHFLSTTLSVCLFICLPAFLSAYLLTCPIACLPACKFCLPVITFNKSSITCLTTNIYRRTYADRQKYL